MSEFKLDMAVRDYECDMQGVVNNAVYQNYLEHARHEFLKAKGLDFAQLTAAGINVFVIRAELDYRRSLRNGDGFTVSIATERESRLRLAFIQKIIHADSGQLILEARIIAVATNAKGRPYFPEELSSLIG